MIKSCNCGKCRKESEHNLGFVWERKGDRWFKMYSIKPYDVIYFNDVSDRKCEKVRRENKIKKQN